MMKEVIKQVSKDLAISRGEAELVVASLLERPRFDIYLNDKVDSNRLKILNIRLAQLKNGVPIEYVTKKVQFMHYLLHLYPGVFIPRIETEFFIELIAESTNFTPESVLEIGTGSGAIAIALAAVFPEANIVATDISENAIECASENIARYNLEDRIDLLQADMFEAISTKFDLIVSNPPYIPRSRLRSLPKSVKEFEPITAINGGIDGVQFINQLISKSKEYLNPDGAAAIEIDEDEVHILRDFLSANHYTSFFFKKDLSGRFRYLFIGNFKNEKSKNIN